MSGSGVPGGGGFAPVKELGPFPPTGDELPRTAFNRVGAEIERRVEENPILDWMRRTSRRELVATFPPGAALLEIGCGTGADAVFLAERGRRVAAIDISDRMVELAEERARARGVGASVRTWRGRLEELRRALATSGWAPFDGVYANFSLTYEGSLRTVALTLRELTKPDAEFVFTLPNRLCLTAPALATIRGRGRDLFERFREPRYLSIRGVSVPSRAYSPTAVRRALVDVFDVRVVRGLPVFMPPPLLFDPARERLCRDLRRLDDRWSRSFPWRYLGETTLYRARRKGA